MGHCLWMRGVLSKWGLVCLERFLRIGEVYQSGDWWCVVVDDVEMLCFFLF